MNCGITKKKLDDVMEDYALFRIRSHQATGKPGFDA